MQGVSLPGITVVESAIIGVSSTEFAIEPGAAGWVIFAPQYTCVTGRLGGCSGDDYPADGTAIEACTLTRRSDCNDQESSFCIPGMTSFYHSTPEEAQAVVCDSCKLGQQKPSEVIATNSTGTDVKTNDVGRTRTNGVMFGLTVLAAVLAFVA